MSAVRKVCAGVALAGSVALLGLAGLIDPGVPAQAAVVTDWHGAYAGLVHVIETGEGMRFGSVDYVAVPYAARQGQLRACEAAITSAVMRGVAVTSGGSTPAIRRDCAHLTAGETRRAEAWAVRMVTLFQS